MMNITMLKFDYVGHKVLFYDVWFEYKGYMFRTQVLIKPDHTVLPMMGEEMSVSIQGLPIIPNSQFVRLEDATKLYEGAIIYDEVLKYRKNLFNVLKFLVADMLKEDEEYARLHRTYLEV